MRRSPLESTIKKLFALSGNRCAFPDCEEKIVDENYIVVGQICHIEGANPNGPRYNNNQTDDERRAFENLMLMCYRHNKTIDSDPDRFIVEKLKKYKEDHERKFLDNQFYVDDGVIDNLRREQFKIFIGRENTFKDFIIFMKNELLENHGLIITGVSGSGKTTLAKDAVMYLLPDFSLISIDLRACKNIKNLHEKITKVVFDEALSNNKRGLLSDQSIHSVLELCSLKKLIFVIDHGELFGSKSEDFQDLITFLLNIPNNCRIIYTSQTDIEFIEDLNIYRLKLPENDEIITMLSNWIETEKEWIEEIANLVGNHPFVVKQIGISCAGYYDEKEKLEKRIHTKIKYTPEVDKYFKDLINDLDDDIKVWIYLASIFNGYIFKEAVPKSTLSFLEEQKLILSSDLEENLDIITFHPIIINAITKDDFDNILKFVLSILDQLPTSPIRSYYTFLCYKRMEDTNKIKNIVMDHWLEWIEILGTHITLPIFDFENSFQNMIETSKRDIKYQDLIKIAYGIARILRGSNEDLIEATRLFKNLYLKEDISIDLKILALSEYIESMRKKEGSKYALEIIKDKIDEINAGIDYIDKMKESKDNVTIYCLGTIYFLLGNLLRSIEDYQEAINVYKKSISCFSLLKTDYNISIQETLAYYGIAESYLRTGEYNRALSTADYLFSLRIVKSYFVKGLTELQRGRAYLMGNEINKGINSIKIAMFLFKKLNLPHYYERCLLVLGVLYLKMGDTNNATNILEKLLQVSDGSRGIDVRIKILLSIINKSKVEISNEEFNIILKHCGSNVLISYMLLLHSNDDKIYELIDEKLNSIKLDPYSNNLTITHTTLSRSGIEAVSKLNWLID